VVLVATVGDRGAAGVGAVGVAVGGAAGRRVLGVVRSAMTATSRDDNGSIFVERCQKAGHSLVAEISSSIVEP
jgi:hypothetical protein